MNLQSDSCWINGFNALKVYALVLFGLLLVVCQTATGTPSVTGVTQNASSVNQYDIYELTIGNTSAYTNPWEDTTITAVFTPTSGTTSTVGGFYYSANTYKLRFAPRIVGNYNWALNVIDTTGTYQTTGSFACVSSTNTGFLRVSGTAYPYGLVTESGSIPFYARGTQGPLPNSASFTDLSQFNFATDSYGQPTKVTDFLLNEKNAGFNFYREMNNQDGFFLIDTFNSGGTGKNLYDISQGNICDEFMAALHTEGFKCLMTFWAAAQGGYVVTNPPTTTISQATLRYHQYLINRFSVYVDVWELLNEKSPVPQAYSDAVTSYVRANDPYQHLLTINFAQTYYSDFDVETWHSYYANGTETVAGGIANSINTLKSDVAQPPMGTEIGMDAPYGGYEPVAFRAMSWTAFFDQGTLMFWNGSAKATYNSGGYSNMYVGDEERGELNTLAQFTAGFDPAATPLTATFTPSGAKLQSYGLASGSDLGLYIVNTNSPNEVVNNGTVTLSAPGGNLQGWWINPTDGTLIAPVTLGAGSQTIPIPSFKADVVLRAHAGGLQPAVRLGSPSYSIYADQGSVSIPVYNPSGGTASVSFSTRDGLAKAGIDYTPGTGTLSWGAGDNTPRTITVPIMFSGTMQANKDFVVYLSAVGSSTPIESAVVTMVIPPSAVNYGVLSAPLYTVPANSGTAAIFTVDRVGNGNGPLTVTYDTRNGTAVAGTDYTSIAQPYVGPVSKLVWASGDVSPKTFTVKTLNQSPSSNRTFIVGLDDGGGPDVPGSCAPPYTRSGVVMLAANSGSQGGILTFTGYSGLLPTSGGTAGASYFVSATAGSISIPVSRTNGSSGAVSASYSFAAGTAISGRNFSANGGTLSWADGDSANKFITFPIVNTLTESGTATIWIVLGNVTSTAIAGIPSVAQLSIIYPPTVLQPNVALQPLSQTTSVGKSVSFSAVGSGPNLSYQWEQGGQPIMGATNSIYTIGSPQTSGSYEVVISNSAGSVTSGTATLTANTGPTITSQPLDQMVNPGQSATFTVGASGTLTYQWSRNGTNIPGATNSSYTTPPAAPTDDGAVFATMAGSTPSNNAILTVPQTSLLNGQLALTYAINKLTSHTYTVQVSGDLRTWNSGSGFTSIPILLDDNGITQTYQVTDQIAAPARFIRLQVSP